MIDFHRQAVVVGGASGIGAATATLLASCGAAVACVDRDGAAAMAVAARIGGLGLVADVTDPDSVRVAFERAAGRFGQLHAVVNSVGIQGPLGNPSHEVDLDDFDATYRINLRGALVVSQHAVRHMLPFADGRIAHVASIAGKEGNPGMVAYSATKAGLIGMVKAQGKEGQGIRGIGHHRERRRPAVIQTDFIAAQPPQVLAYMTDKIPMRRTGTVEEVAAVLAFMLSRECAFTTGFTFDASGGRATY